MPPAPSRIPLASPAAAVVFSAVLTQGPISRVEIARRTGLSSAAVTKATRPLIAAGYLVEGTDERPGGGLGRPANPLTVQADRQFFLGIKLTADEVIGVVTDLRLRTRAVRHRLLSSTRPEDVVAQLAETVADLLAEAPEYRQRTRWLGLAVSGDVDPSTGLVRRSPFLHWENVPLAHQVQTLTDLQTAIDNDVRALTVAEQWFGAGVGASSFALVTIGTGVGCGLVLDGSVVSGAHGVAGELGHLVVAIDGPRCHCGNRGCVEAIASDPAILGQVRTAAGAPELTMGQAVALARGGDAAAREVFSRAGRVIGIAVASMANLVGPERIVISGEGLAAADLVEDQIRAAFAAHAFGAAGDCELILRPRSFDDWARGAAAVAIRSLITLDKG